MAKILMIQLQPSAFAGTAYLCGAARSAGHDFALYLGTGLEEILERIRQEQPDCLGFSCMSGFHIEILGLCREIKKRVCLPIILGGPHPTLFPEVIREECVDIICRGEGEFALIDYLNALEAKKPVEGIPNLWVKKEGAIIENGLRPLAYPLDNVPMIDWTCYQGTPVKHALPLAHPIRGCPYSCTYCFNPATRALYKGLGPYIRRMTPQRAVEEVKKALDFFDPGLVIFESDTFGDDLAWTKDMLSRYANLTDMPFVLFLRPELATPAFLDLISEYRCHAVAIGVESGSERLRREVLNRHHSNDFLISIAKNLHSRGIAFRSLNILGLPSETEQEMWETVHLNQAMAADIPRASIFTPFPGTKIVDFAVTTGFLDQNFSFDDLPYSTLSHSILKNVNTNRIQNMFYFFQTAVLFPWAEPFLRLLVRMKSNLVFRLWFYTIFSLLYKKLMNMSWPKFIHFLWSNRSNI